MQPAPRTVWAVRLGVSTDDVEGTLSLGGADLLFTVPSGEIRIPLASIIKVKRVKGSAVLTVKHRDARGATARYAFFFVKPPPLNPQPGKSKRKAKRQSIMYLQAQGREVKEHLREWERAIRDTAAQAGAG